MGVMNHPLMFDRDDPVLARVRKICLALPGAREKVSHGRPWFCTSTGFAVYGGTLRGDTATSFGTALLVRADPQERPALLAGPPFFEPAYLWPSGWVGLDLSPAGTDWTEAAELVETSYRLTAPRRLVRELDMRG